MPPKKQTSSSVIRSGVQKIDTTNPEKMMQSVNQKIQLKKKQASSSPIVIPESKPKSAVDKSLGRTESPPTFTTKYREDSYCGPKLPLNAFQCYLKALKNHTTKQARDKW